MKLNFGLFDQFEWPSEKDYSALLKEKFQIVRLAERLRCFDTFFSTERHFTRLSANPSQSALISALSQVTQSIRLCALVYILPIRNPILLAEEISMLDYITSGRLEIGFGSGISELELEHLGLDPVRARAVSKEALRVILDYFSTDADEFSFNGRYYKFDELPKLLKPLQQPYPPVWIPSRNQETMKWLGRQGFNTAWIFDTYDRIKTAFDNYWINFKDCVKKTEPKVGIVRHLFVAKSDDEAIRKVRPALINYGKDERFLFKSKRLYARKRKGYQPFDLYSFENPDYLIRRDIAIAGSPKTVSKKIRRAISATGANYFMPYMDFGNLNNSSVTESLELFSSEVYPDFDH